MTTTIDISESDEPERALLVGVDFGRTEWPLEQSLAELGRLAQTAGAVVVGTITQRLDAPHPRTFIGSGKVEEIAQRCKDLQIRVVILDDEISPSQQGNLEHALPPEVKVIDRTALILDIFGLHATTYEGRIQVRLAQNQYLLPRLRGMWAHLASNRMGGGVGSRFGEGESQLEVDRRMVRKRITGLKRELKEVSSSRGNQRKSRDKSGMFRIALAGYTNAGKSSLLNNLTGSSVLAYDKLFATLDSTTRKLVLPEGREVTITDTVGFIQKLPTTLVEAFKSTLIEASSADLILQVTDASDPQRDAQAAVVHDILAQIGAELIPVVRVLNKADRLDTPERNALAARYPGAIVISAKTGEGVDELISAIGACAAASSVMMRVLIPFTRGDIVRLAHERAQTLSEEYVPMGTEMLLRVPHCYARQFSLYQIGREDAVQIIS
jgi:GTP-binding protein HflX